MQAKTKVTEQIYKNIKLTLLYNQILLSSASKIPKYKAQTKTPKSDNSQWGRVGCPTKWRGTETTTTFYGYERWGMEA